MGNIKKSLTENEMQEISGGTVFPYGVQNNTYVVSNPSGADVFWHPGRIKGHIPYGTVCKESMRRGELIMVRMNANPDAGWVNISDLELKEG